MNINLIPYRPEHHETFRQINLEWLDHYNLKESHDVMVLDDPKGTILDSGGCIWLAEVDGLIVGSAALMREHDDVYELAKMSVTEQWRGKGISKLLIEKCLETAKQLGATKLTLYSNHQLQTAISLYLKYGFKHVPVVDSPFVTADVRMELTL
jgi:GNAT superfamily N-acetyltransferase